MSSSLIGRLSRRFGQVETSADRRDFLRASLITGSALMLSGPGALASMTQAAGKRIVVVGAGFAGLAAAYELKSVGYDVTVIEARNRISGRVLSFGDFVPGKNVEGGGELIGSNHPAWVAYAEKFGLEFLDVTEAEDAEFPIILGGQRLTGEESEALWEEMDTALQVMNADAESIDADEPWKSPGAEAFDKLSMQEWIARQEVPALCKMAMAAGLTADNGVATKHQSYLGLLAAVKAGGLDKYWSDSEVYRCKGGNQQLAMKLAEGLGQGRIVTGVAVKSISARGKELTVGCGDGRTLTCDDVVLAVPPPIWKKIEMQPGLPGALNPQMGTNVKMLSRVKSRYWEAAKLAPDMMTDDEVSMTWEGTDGQLEGAEACLNCFSGGPGAEKIRSREAADRMRKYSETLETVYPGYGKNVDGTRFMDWPGEQWTGAGYSFPAPGQVTTVGPLLAQAHAGGRLHLAGEHCCYKYVGYMEGALQSGLVAAKRIAVRDGAMKS